MTRTVHSATTSLTTVLAVVAASSAKDWLQPASFEYALQTSPPPPWFAIAAASRASPEYGRSTATGPKTSSR